MTMDVFDPGRHRIVAIDEKGRHFHLTLPELAMDMSKVDFKPFFDRMRDLEAMAKATPVPPSVDLTPLEARVQALEEQPAPEVQKLPDLSPILDAISDLSQRVAAVEQRPDASPAEDLSPLLKEIASAADARHVDQETKLQALAQAVDNLATRVSGIESAMTDLLRAAERRLSA